MFSDRIDAGKKLANKLLGLKSSNAVVIAIPRGGVVVGYQVARELNLPLSIIIPRKIRAEGNPELAIGAVTEDSVAYLNQDIIRALGVSAEYIKSEIKLQVEEIKRRKKRYLEGRASQNIEGKTAVVVDDGLATGSTAVAAIRAIRKQRPNKIILAVPVAPIDSVHLLEKEADEVIAAHMPKMFYAVGQFYERFEQTSDEEVKLLLQKAT